MKKNDVILIVSIILYSFLFYEQSAGINFLLFNAGLITLLIIRDKNVYRQKNWQLAAAGSLISATCITLYANGLSVTANIISLCALSAYSFRPKTSIITSICFSFASIIGSFVFMILDIIHRASKPVVINDKKQSGSKWLIYSISFVIVLVFFLLYKSSNPLFDNFTKNINFDFISLRWVVFTLSGLFLLYGFFYHKVIRIISEREEAKPNDLLLENSSNKSIFNLSVENENRSGVVLLVSLNILLLLVNLLDANFMFINSTLPSGLTYSQFVHQGTGTLILSIIIAISIILYYFRSGLNFYSGNKQLKMLAYAWVFQNIFMICSTAFRNNLYIAEYSLTYKRIGVYVWLLLALIGLLTTFVKIFRVKSNWYLFRSNGWLFYAALVISCVFNWDVIVADYNIASAAKNNKAIDKFYLLDLSDKILPQLLSLENWDKNKKSEKMEIPLSEREFLPSDVSFNRFLSESVYKFLLSYQGRQWKSWNYSDRVIHDQIIALNREEKINRFDISSYEGVFSLASISELDGIKTLNLSGDFGFNLHELTPFKKLTALNLSDCNINSILSFPDLENLTSLDLSGNQITNLAMIRNAPNLEQLDLSKNENLHDFRSLLCLKKLKHLVIGNITQKGFDTLQMLFPDTKIVANIYN
ncbi:MAG: hypothetical protein JWP12_418 [Bacteroidetes bacterium]|nr:hypothetical protein [Bacteroidota bacterium]